MQLLLSPPSVLLTILISGTFRLTQGNMLPADPLAFLLLGLGLTAPIAAMIDHNLEDAQAALRAWTGSVAYSVYRR